MYHAYREYKQAGKAFDIYQNLYDISLPLQYDCNPFNTNGFTSFTMYMMTPILNYFIVQT